MQLGRISREAPWPSLEIIADEGYLIKPKIKNEIVKSLAKCSGMYLWTGQTGFKIWKQKKNNQIIDMQKKNRKLFNFCLYAVGVIAKKWKRKNFFK